MNYNGQTYISIEDTKEDFKKINLRVASKNEDWNKAINIFKNRISGRYFNAIDIMIEDRNIIEGGFVIMALNCLLIETLFQFVNGYDVTPSGNKENHSNFLCECFDVDKSIGHKFYKDIRCGILHSAQTKNGSQLTFDNEYVIKMEDDKTLRVDIINFTAVLRAYYLKYIEDLNKNCDDTIRFNFIKKMNYICG